MMMTRVVVMMVGLVGLGMWGKLGTNLIRRDALARTVLSML